MLALVLPLVAIIASGCTQKFDRKGVPAELVEQAEPLAPHNVREWGDKIDPAMVEAGMSKQAAILRERFADDFAAGVTPRLSYLLLSGGGQHGAFGAGVLRGWTESGTRPKFDAVSGVSTGALIAPFAFLGSDYDDLLEEFYTTNSTDDLLIGTIFSGLTAGSALASTAPLRAKIKEFITPDIIRQIAEEHRKGRFLLVGTTNLEVGRQVIWNMGAIAASEDPRAPKLFRDVLLASASIPLAFPPVFIDVEADGQVYDEMHVDGGVTSQVAIVSPQRPNYRLVDLVGHNIERDIYVLINGRITLEHEKIPPRVHRIGGSSINAMLYAGTVTDLYKIYAIAERDGMNPYFLWTPDEFKVEPQEAFDPVYMRQLYDYGRTLIRQEGAWSSYPPYFAAPRGAPVRFTLGHEGIV